MTHLPLLLAQIVVVILATRVVGFLFARIGQPRVVEIGRASCRERV